MIYYSPGTDQYLSYHALHETKRLSKTVTSYSNKITYRISLPQFLCNFFSYAILCNNSLCNNMCPMFDKNNEKHRRNL